MVCFIMINSLLGSLQKVLKSLALDKLRVGWNLKEKEKRISLFQDGLTSPFICRANGLLANLIRKAKNAASCFSNEIMLRQLLFLSSVMENKIQLHRPVVRLTNFNCLKLYPSSLSMARYKSMTDQKEEFS